MLPGPPTAVIVADKAKLSSGAHGIQQPMNTVEGPSSIAPEIPSTELCLSRSIRRCGSLHLRRTPRQ